MIRIPSTHSFVGVGEVKGRKLGDTLSYAYHSTPPPLRWHEWPDIPSVTTHFPKKMCHVSPGQSTISDPHLRTLALQVYPNMLRSESASSYQDLVKLVDAGSSTAKLQWEYAGNVQFPHNGALPAERFSGPSWKEMSTTEQTTTVKAPMMFYMMANDAAKLFPPHTVMWNGLAEYDAKYTLDLCSISDISIPEPSRVSFKGDHWCALRRRKTCMDDA